MHGDPGLFFGRPVETRRCSRNQKSCGSSTVPPRVRIIWILELGTRRLMGFVAADYPDVFARGWEALIKADEERRLGSEV